GQNRRPPAPLPPASAPSSAPTCYPRRMSDEDPILVCCPYCIRSLGTIDEPDEPFTLPEVCPRCGMDPRNDAPIEITLLSWSDMPKKPCAACGKDVPALAVRCG